MSGLLDKCKKLFGGTTLYDVLGIDSSASATEVKRGYHKLSLSVHPDRVAEKDKETATEKFQVLGKVYSVLSDKDKRAIYDESGEIDEENETQERDWAKYWRLLFAKISVKDIQEFEAKYKGSEEELSDLKSAYVDYEGDMDKILDGVLCASLDDEGRFRSILKGCIERKEIPEFKTFTNESSKKKKKRKKKAEAEALEAEEYAKELGLGEENSLQALILKNQKSREAQMSGFLANLEAKYAKPAKSKAKGKSNGASPSKKKKS
ncbi:dnaJ homolog subfamily C member 9-like [Liolophura sinensis]|uniref:dnaJ homolog subfamily C member 9-like n=1 Tax=Liolophura sinensis TaxID=3198878 RepID=UPI0031588D78